MFCKIPVLKHFAEFTGKHLRYITLKKSRIQCMCFPVNFAKFLRTPFYRTPPNDYFHSLNIFCNLVN